MGHFYVEKDGKFWNSSCAMFVRSSCDATIYTLYDTALHAAEGGELTWKNKKHFRQH